ncbi:zinc ABC transporter substrate-binding protein [Haloechinothrix salitolerans]
MFLERDVTTGVRISRAVAIAAVVGMASGCSPGAADDQSDSGPVKVAAGFYPLRFLAERIGGPDAEVTGLTPPGTEPHDLTLTGPARAAAEEAEVMIYAGEDYQPEVTDVVRQRSGDMTALDILAVSELDLLHADKHHHGHGGDRHADEDSHDHSGDQRAVDPHVWLDPLRYQRVADAVTETLARERPERRASFEQRRDELKVQLRDVHRHLRDATSDCASRTLITNHAAFGYLADRYDLEQVPIAGLSPEHEPDPGTLARIATEARRANVSTIFAEEGIPAKLARAVADEAGAEVGVLAVIEFAPTSGDGADGGDYVSRMHANADALQAGLDCR